MGSASASPRLFSVLKSDHHDKMCTASTLYKVFFYSLDSLNSPVK